MNILKNKIVSLNFFWDFPTVLNLWKNFTSHTFTNIDVDDIKYAWNLISKTNLDTIKFTTLDTEENQLLISGEMVINNINAFILKPSAGVENYFEIRNFVASFINQPASK